MPANALFRIEPRTIQRWHARIWHANAARCRRQPYVAQPLALQEGIIESIMSQQRRAIKHLVRLPVLRIDHGSFPAVLDEEAGRRVGVERCQRSLVWLRLLAWDTAFAHLRKVKACSTSLRLRN
jgi:hypothetical protein